MILIAILVVALAVALFFDYLRPEGNRVISQFRLVILVGTLVFAFAVLYTIAFAWRAWSPAAVFIRCGDEGLELDYPNGRTDRLTWSDPDMHFEVRDLSAADSAQLLVGTPFFILVTEYRSPFVPRDYRSIQSALTPEAFHAIMAQVRARGLVDRTGVGTRWYYPSSAMPIIYNIRGKRDSNA